MLKFLGLLVPPRSYFEKMNFNVSKNRNMNIDIKYDVPVRLTLRQEPVGHIHDHQILPYYTLPDLVVYDGA